MIEVFQTGSKRTQQCSASVQAGRTYPRPDSFLRILPLHFMAGLKQSQAKTRIQMGKVRCNTAQSGEDLRGAVWVGHSPMQGEPQHTGPAFLNGCRIASLCAMVIITSYKI
jgi:hypothetical protein